MNVIEAIHARRAVRAYSSRTVDEATVRSLLLAAVHAPTAMNEQSWVFAVVQNREQLARLSDRAKAMLLDQASPDSKTRQYNSRLQDPEFNIFYDASTLVVIGSRQRGTYTDADCWLAAENLMLAACDAGLGFASHRPRGAGAQHVGGEAGPSLPRGGRRGGTDSSSAIRAPPFPPSLEPSRTSCPGAGDGLLGDRRNPARSDARLACRCARRRWWRRGTSCGRPTYRWLRGGRWLFRGGVLFRGGGKLLARPRTAIPVSAAGVGTTFDVPSSSGRAGGSRDSLGRSVIRPAARPDARSGQRGSGGGAEGRASR